MKTCYSFKRICYTALTIILLCLLCLSATAAMALKVGDAAPDFAVLDNQGIQRTMADYQGQVVIINFWASYCPPCRQEKPSMDQLYQDKKNQGLKILAITLEKKRSLEKYLKKNPLGLTVLRDAQGTMHRSYGVLVYPHSVIVNRHGTIIQVFYGPQDWTGPSVSEVITPLLAE